METTKNVELDFVTLDVFTHERFIGNPLAIVNVPRHYRNLGQAQKQLIAREFNFSETVFLHEEDRHSSSSLESREIDIFTTTAEIPFAGHPTIGTACYLLSMSPASNAALNDGLRQGTIVTKAGDISISLNAEGTEAAASIPHSVHVHAAGVPQGDIISMQPGLKPCDLARSCPVVSIVKGMTFVLVQLPDEAALAAVTTASPLFHVLRDRGWDEGLVGFYYYVRMPNADSSSTMQLLRTRMIERGLEDPATGSAACALTSYLSLTAEKIRPSTFNYLVTQGVEMGRKSDIGVTVMTLLDGAHGPQIDNITLVGGAVIVTRGKLIV